MAAEDVLVAELPFGEAGMVAHENRLRSQPHELLNAEGVSFQDDHIQRQDGAVVYDATGIGTATSFFGTIASNTPPIQYISSAVTFRGNFAVPGNTFCLKNSGAADIPAASQTVQTFTTPAGNLAVIAFGIKDAFSIAPTEHVFACTDTQGNTYTKVHESFFGIWGLVIFYSILANPVTGADLVTLSSFAPTFIMSAAGRDFPNPKTRSPIDATAIAQGTNAASGQAFSSGSVGTLGELPQLTFGAALAIHLDPVDPPTITPNGTFVGGLVQVLSTTQRLATGERLETTQGQISGIHNFRSEQEEASVPGTVSTTAGSETVTGAGTTFTSYAPGDYFMVLGERRVIDEIASATSLTVTESFLVTNAGAAYTVETGSRLITTSTDGSIYEELPLTVNTGDLDSVALASTITPGLEPIYFVRGGREAAANLRHLFIFSGRDPVQVLDGNTGTLNTLATPPADWAGGTDPFRQPIAGTIHRDRLCGFGNLNEPHRLYFSDPDDHENFTNAAASQLPVHSEVGERIVASTSFNGVLFIFKYPVGIFWLDDSNLQTSDWAMFGKSSVLGAAESPYAVLPIDDDILLMSPDGHVHLVSAVDAMGGVNAGNITKRLGLSRWIKDNVNVSLLSRMRSIYDPFTKEARFFVPGTDATVPNLTMAFNFGLASDGGAVRFSYSRRDTVLGATTRDRRDGFRARVAFADAGTLYIEQDAKNKDGFSYTTEYATPELNMSHLDPGLGPRRKTWQEAELVFGPDSTGTVNVSWEVDGRIIDSTTVDATNRRRRFRISGDGYTLKLSVSQNNENDNAKVLGGYVWFGVGNEDQSRS